MDPELSVDWYDWIVDNFNRGVYSSQLLEDGFTRASIDQALGWFGDPQSSSGVVHQHLSIPFAKLISSQQTEIYQLDSFLTAEECTAIDTMIRPGCRCANGTLGEAVVPCDVRACSLPRLGEVHDSLLDSVDRRICRLFGLHPIFGKRLRAATCSSGEVIRTDRINSQKFDSAPQGQGTLTILILLRIDEQGGQTPSSCERFSFKPKKGSALVWSDLDSENRMPGRSKLGEGLMIQGAYSILTKSFRTRDDIIRFNKTPNEYNKPITRHGFLTRRVPTKLFKEIVTAYRKDLSSEVNESLGSDVLRNGPTSSSPSAVIPISDGLRANIHRQLRPIVEDWARKSVTPTFVYGIRVYKQGAILAMHRYRIETHTLGVIINVDQQCATDWPLTIEDHLYRRHDILMKPGEMILFESARFPHGRLPPFLGNRYANLFAHFSVASGSTWC